MKVERRYARAFLETASETDLENLSKAVEQLQRGRTLFYLSLPTFSLYQKREFLRSYLPSLTEYVERFLSLLLKKGRIALLPNIMDELLRLKMEREGISEAYVRSAVPLTPVEKERLIKALENRFHKKIVLKEEVDPSLIGGLTVEVDGNLIDASLKGFLLKLRSYLLRREEVR